MVKRQRSDPVPLTELLDAAAVDTPGALVDLLAERGDGVTIDQLGRLAAPLPVAERLWAEQAERERIAMEEAERAEEERLRRLEQHVREQEAVAEQQARQLAAEARQRRLEQASGLPLWQLEAEIRRSRTHAAGTYLDLDRRRIEDDAPITMDEAEQWLRQMYGDRVLEGDGA